MDRKEAIEALAQKQLKTLSQDERDEQLFVMSAESWAEDEEWKKLPSEIRKQFDDDIQVNDPENEKYDCVLLVWLRDELKAARNEFLVEELKKNGVGISSIQGQPQELISCPCCGYRTLTEPSSYDICTVCWWEDDGQDNAAADEEWGGPNYGISLTQARYNFLTEGIYDPTRGDLISNQEPSEKFVQGREFYLKSENEVAEKNASWVGNVE